MTRYQHVIYRNRDSHNTPLPHPPYKFHLLIIPKTSHQPSFPLRKNKWGDQLTPQAVFIFGSSNGMLITVLLLLELKALLAALYPLSTLFACAVGVRIAGLAVYGGLVTGAAEFGWADGGIHMRHSVVKFVEVVEAEMGSPS